MVTQLSPMTKSKKGNSYYHGVVCDGKTSLRVMKFSSTQHKDLQEYLQKRESVEFVIVKSKNLIMISKH